MSGDSPSSNSSSPAPQNTPATEPPVPMPPAASKSSSSVRPVSGPLARFTRGGGTAYASAAQVGPSADAGSPPAAPATGVASSEPPLSEGLSASSAASGPEGGASAIAEPRPARRPPRGRDREKSRREKEREEDQRLERELAAESPQATQPRARVPVPNRRQRSEELEAEVAAALGGVSLDAIVSGELKVASQQLETGSHHRGQVIEVHGDDVFVALGGKNQGVTSVRSFPTPPQPGEMVDVIVTGYSRDDDLYELSVAGGKVVAADWADLSEGSIVEARVTGANTGGLECQVNNLRGFIPVSQIGLYHVDNPAEYVGQKLLCVVTEANARRGNLVLSRRALLEREKEEARRKLLAELAPGQTREGTVRKILDFGAFVDLGGVDGLIPLSQLSWERVKHPSEVLQEGQKVRVRIERIDEATGKISLSLKHPEENPWANVEERFPIGSLVKGTVSRLAQFGAFVKLAPGVEGLIHISELAHHKVHKVEHIVKEGQEVECRVLDVDPQAQRISLSLKAALAKPEAAAAAAPETEEPPRELAVPRRTGPLKGGLSRPSGGEKFGLKW